MSACFLNDGFLSVFMAAKMGNIPRTDHAESYNDLAISYNLPPENVQTPPKNVQTPPENVQTPPENVQRPRENVQSSPTSPSSPVKLEPTERKKGGF